MNMKKFMNPQNNCQRSMHKTVDDVVLSLCHHETETAIQRCCQKEVFWKYAANIQENTHAKVWFQ